jgi:hypothetical protein
MLLSNMDALYPDVLIAHNIDPLDYKSGLVFRSAIESIRGTFIASSTTNRRGMVGKILENLKQINQIVTYQRTGTSNRYDFEIQIARDPDYFAILEVKGGEGNSINISQRPLAAKEFCLWCHLDGAIVNQPAYGAHAILNRVTNEMMLRSKHVDAILFKDVLCGTRARPCPKYPGKESVIGLDGAPDIFLLPQSIPSLANPRPPVHSIETLRLVRLILDSYGVAAHEYPRHIWEVQLEIFVKAQHLKWRTEIWHQGKQVDSSESCSRLNLS